MISFRKASTPDLKTSRGGEPTISASSLGHSTSAKHLKYLLSRNWCAILTQDAVLWTGLIQLQKKGTVKWVALLSRCIKDIVAVALSDSTNLKLMKAAVTRDTSLFLWCTTGLLACTGLTWSPCKNSSAKVKGNGSSILEIPGTGKVPWA